MPTGTPYVVEGKTAREIAQELKLCPSTIRHWIAAGCDTLEKLKQRAAHVGQWDRGAEQYRIEGLTFREIAERYGVNDSLLRARAALGAKTIEELLAPRRGEKKKSQLAKDFGNLKLTDEELCEKWGLPPRMSLEELENETP